MTLIKLGFLVILFAMFGCGDPTSDKELNERPSVISFDVFEDDSTIAVLTCKRGTYTVAVHHINSRSKRVVYESAEDEMILNIDISPDEERILLTTTKESNYTSSTLKVINLKKPSVISLPIKDYILIKAEFVAFQNQIVMLMAKEINHYSPIASDLPHNYDFYLINLSDSSINRISNLKAYNITDICFYSGALYFNRDFEGPYKINYDGTTSSFTNNGRCSVLKSTMDCGSFYIRHNELYYTNSGGYTIFRYDMKTRTNEKVLQVNFQISNLRPALNPNEILFLKYDKRAIHKLYINEGKIKRLDLDYF
ncbi:MAG: hypothetical protein JNK73_02405 [Bacteroidia bacterium]|nr:hypothetical protein [Bacteroidia bacterium]